MREGPLDNLIRALARLPGLGPRSAQRIALHLVTGRGKTLEPLIAALVQAQETIRTCEICGNLDMASPCRICQDPRRAQRSLCIVASVADLWAIERTGGYRDQYHILGGVLSALDGRGPEDLAIEQLLERIRENPPSEIILALSATVDGQATSHYLTDRIGPVPGMKITRLAHGVPVGGELDYLDDGTIITALKSRASL